MWSELNLKEMAAEEHALAGPHSAKEVEELVVMVRLHLYNQGAPCGARALRQRLDRHYSFTPLPSESTINRILSRQCLTHKRTGSYDTEA